LKSILFLLLFVPQFLAAQDSIARSAAWTIVEAVHDTIAARHPFSFLGDNRAKLADALSRIKPRLDELLESRPGDSLTYSEVIGLAAPLQEVTECGHTMLRRKKSPKLKKALDARPPQIRTMMLEDGRYVLIMPLAVGEDTLAVGTEIVEYEGRPLPFLVEELSVFYGVNDHGFQEGVRSIIAQSIDYYFQSLHGPRDTVSISIAGSSEPINYRIPLLIEKNESSEKTESKTKNKYVIKAEFNDERTVGYLNVPSFNDRSFRPKHVRKAIAEINAAGVDKLIIDVRGNLGGDLGNTNYLFRLLAREPFVRLEKFESYSPNAKPKNFFSRLANSLLFGLRHDGDRYHKPKYLKYTKPVAARHRFTGDVVVMINGSTFSAASLFAHYVQSYGRGELVGTVSGGSNRVSYGGRNKSYPIGPNGELFLRMMNFRLDLPNPGSGNLTPDHLLPATLEMLKTAGDDRRGFSEEVLLGKQ